MTQKKVGVKCLNNENREALGRKSPFEVYFSGKFNDLIKESLDTRDGTIYKEVYELSAASSYQKQHEQNLKVCEKAGVKSRSIDERMMKAHARKNCYVTYNADNKVFVRLSKW